MKAGGPRATRRRSRGGAGSSAILLAAIAGAVPPLAPAAFARDDGPPATTEDSSLWSRLDHDRFLRRLSALGLERTLEALEATEPTDDEIERLRRRIAATRLALVAEPRDPEAIASAAANAVALRSAMIDASAIDDLRRGRWLADQAEDVLLWILPAGGADLACRFGTATAAQRDTVDRWLPLAAAAADEAVVAQENALARIAARPPADPLADLHRRRLAEDLPRIRLLQGATRVSTADLLDAVSDPAARRRAAIEGIEAHLDEVSPDLAELGRLQVGLARSALGEHRLAIRDLTALAADAAASPRRRFEALVGIVLDTAVREDRDNALQRLASLRRRHLDDPDATVFALPWADLEHRLLVEERISRGAAPAQAEAAAIGPWIDLLEERPPVERDALVDLVLRRIRDAAPPTEDAPAAVRLAHAERGGDLPAEERRRLLTAARDRAEAGSAIRMVALRRLAQADLDERRWMEAIDGLRTVALEYPEEAPAPATIDAAVELAVSLVETTGRPEHDRLARDTVTEALRAFPRHREADRWLLRQAEFESADERFEAAMETLARIRPDRPLARHAEVQSLETTTRAAESADGRDVARWIDRAEAWLRRLEPWPSSTPDGRDPEVHRSLGIRVALARARLHLLADRPAAALVEVATIRESESLTREQMVEGVRIRLAAFDRLDRPEDAAEELRRLSDGGDAESGSLLEGRLEVALAAIRRADADGDRDRVSRIGGESAGPLAEALLAWLDARDTPPSPRSILLVAEGLRRAGRPTEGLRALGRLDERYGDLREYAVERAECLYAVGGLDDLAEAMRLFRRVAAGTPAESPSWWLAELRQLQILERVGRDTDRIPPRIERLRALDAELGGEGLRRQFESLLLSLP